MEKAMRNKTERDPQLTRLQQQIGAWRKRRINPRQRIPQGFWQQAVELARTRGVCRVAAVLHLNYYGLQRRLPGAEGRGPVPAVEGPTFIELPRVAGLESGVCRVELVGRRGAKLVLQLAQDNLPALRTVLEMFWGPGR
jgi:hypothetical protein